MTELYLGVTVGLFIAAYINDRYDEKERWIPTRYIVWAAILSLALSVATTDWQLFWDRFREVLRN